MRQTLWRWLPPLAWMGLVFILSAQPDLPHVPGALLDTLLKKGGHAAAFGVLAWLYLRALRGGGPSTHRLRLLSLALTVLYACSDELHQAFVPGRNPRLSDVLVDSAGAMLALALEALRAR